MVIVRKIKDDKIKVREIYLKDFKDDFEKVFKRLRFMKEE